MFEPPPSRVEIVEVNSLLAHHDSIAHCFKDPRTIPRHLDNPPSPSTAHARYAKLQRVSILGEALRRGSTAMPTELLQSLTLDARDTQLGDTNGVVIAKAIEANKPLQLFSLHAYAMT